MRKRRRRPPDREHIIRSGRGRSSQAALRRSETGESDRASRRRQARAGRSRRRRCNRWPTDGSGRNAIARVGAPSGLRWAASTAAKGGNAMKRASGWSSAGTLGRPAGCLAFSTGSGSPCSTFPGVRTGHPDRAPQGRARICGTRAHLPPVRTGCADCSCAMARWTSRSRTSPHCRGTSSPAPALEVEPV
jgi:hypothetical protein